MSATVTIPLEEYDRLRRVDAATLKYDVGDMLAGRKRVVLPDAVIDDIALILITSLRDRAAVMVIHDNLSLVKSKYCAQT